MRMKGKKLLTLIRIILANINSIVSINNNTAPFVATA